MFFRFGGFAADYFSFHFYNDISQTVGQSLGMVVSFVLAQRILRLAVAENDWYLLTSWVFYRSSAKNTIQTQASSLLILS